MHLGGAFEGGKDASALLVGGATVDEGLAQSLRVFPQRKDVVTEHYDLVAAHLRTSTDPFSGMHGKSIMPSRQTETALKLLITK